MTTNTLEYHFRDTFRATDRVCSSPGEAAACKDLDGSPFQVLKRVPGGMFLCRFPSDFEMACHPAEVLRKTPIDSIVIPKRFVHACVGWEGGMDCMLRAVTSTGNLTTGITCPAGCDGDEEKWYLTIWRELSADLGAARREAWNHGGDDADVDALGDFECWVDEVIIPRLEDEYGLADWNACDG